LTINVTVTGSEALSPTDTTLNVTFEVDSELRTPSPTKSRPLDSVSKFVGTLALGIALEHSFLFQSREWIYIVHIKSLTLSKLNITPPQDIPEEISEQIPASSQHDIPTEVSVSSASEDPETPMTETGMTEEPVTPVSRRGVMMADTPGRDADVETEFESSPEKGK